LRCVLSCGCFFKKMLGRVSRFLGLQCISNCCQVLHDCSAAQKRENCERAEMRIAASTICNGAIVCLKAGPGCAELEENFNRSLLPAFSGFKHLKCRHRKLEKASAIKCGPSLYRPDGVEDTLRAPVESPRRRRGPRGPPTAIANAAKQHSRVVNLGLSASRSRTHT
jgi:hypothetical protein